MQEAKTQDRKSAAGQMSVARHKISGAVGCFYV
jgi:hypothetical protein